MPKPGKLELTWVGKDERVRLEPRVLVEDPVRSYGNPDSENMLIYGDNLLALKALEQDFAGKLKCIYIDPPYNTGSAWAHYDDGLEHSLWLSMMRDRLDMIRRLLAEDGSLWINIDDNECHYLKVMCDEIFGRQNFVTSIIWEKADSPRNSARQFSADHDYVLVFSRNPEWIPCRLPRTDEANSIYSNPDSDPRGPWLPGDPYANKPYSSGRYKIKGPTGRTFQPPPGRFWRVSEERLRQLDADGRVWWGPTGSARPSIKRYLSEVADLVPRTLWSKREVGSNRTSKNEMRALFPGSASFATPKPERLIERVMQIATKPGDWVLDSFAGSGTTGAAAHKMGRRWIMVELGDHCHTHIIPRMKKVIDGEDKGGITEAVGWQGGGGFRYYRLAETLLVCDKDLSANRHPVYIINPRYDERMLIRAICKIERFRYRNEGRLHGMSSENRFLHVTTRLLTQMYVDSLAEDVGRDQSLLIYCTRRRRGLDVPDNVELKRIPRDLLAKCDFQESIR